MKAIIIEDELGSQKVLKSLLSEYVPAVNVLECLENVKDGVKSIQKHKPDIVFLDIELPRENGFALFNYFDQYDFEVIFTTAYDKYAIKAFQYAAIDYLLKPIDIKRLIAAVERVSTSRSNIEWQKHISTFNDFLDKKTSKIPVPTLEGYSFIDLDEIIYLEADSSYTHIILPDEKLTVTKNIGHWEAILQDHSFQRIHRSYIINLQKVIRYIRAKSPSVILPDQVNIPVSPTNKNTLLKNLGLPIKE